MSTSIDSTELAAAARAVRAAAALCESVRRGADPGARAKADASPVTVADYGAQALVAAALAESFPDDPLVAEEDSADLRRPENSRLLDRVAAAVSAVRGAAVDCTSICQWIDRGAATPDPAGRFWTLDPIDGTKGYLRGGQYAVALALVVGGRVEVAALACPSLGDDAGAVEPGPGRLFLAVRGGGATEAPMADDTPGRPIRVAAAGDPAALRFCESVESGHSAHGDAAAVAARLGLVDAPLRLDSQAKYAVVARGEAAAYLRLPTRADYREAIWDHAAGSLIVAEAGGTVTDVDGRPLDFTRGRRLESNRGVVVTGGLDHARLVAVLGELGIGAVE